MKPPNHGLRVLVTPAERGPFPPGFLTFVRRDLLAARGYTAGSRVISGLGIRDLSRIGNANPHGFVYPVLTSDRIEALR